MDKRAVADPGKMPYRISHVHDLRGENFVVEYAERVDCMDGVKRQKIWYNCRKAHVEIDSEEHSAGHFAAQEAAWKHVTDVLERGGNATDVDERFGLGGLSGSGRFRHHGDPHEDFCFKVHPRRPDFGEVGITTWRPQRDTLIKPTEYCSDCRFVRRTGSGTETWKCLGHEVDTGATPAE